MFKKINYLIIFCFFGVISAQASPPATPYLPGQILNPACAPGTSNCTVTPSSASGANSDITSLSGLTTPLSFSQGGTGLSTIGSAGQFLKVSSGNLPAWETVGINNVDGVLNFTKGGTGLTTIGSGELLYASNPNILSPLSLSNDLLINSGVLSINNSNLVFTASQVSDFNGSVDGRIVAQKAQLNGLATLGADGKIPTEQLSSIAINHTYVVANSSDLTSLAASVGDIAVATSDNKTYVLQTSPASVLGNWVELLTPASVTSVNSKTGVVNLTSSDINEGTNLYFTDERSDDRVNALINDGVGIYKTYNDSANTLTLNINEGSLSINNLGGSPLSANKGGTGLSSIANGELIYGSGPNVFSVLGAGSTGQVLKISGGLPVWGTDSDTLYTAGTGLALNANSFAVDQSVLNLNNFIGTLGVDRGGTGQTGTTTAFNALAPLQTNNSGKFLTTDGSSVSWAAVPGGITDHALLTNIGSSTHAQLDAHLINYSNPHQVTALQIGANNLMSEINNGTSTINWSRINKSGSSLADLTTKNYSDLSGRPGDDDFYSLAAETTINGLDELLIYSQANAGYRKITRTNLVAGLGAGGSTAWSALTTPTSNLSLSLGNYTTNLNFGSATGASNLFSLSDTASNSGTGYLLSAATASGSSLNPLAIGAKGINYLTVSSLGVTTIGTSTSNLTINANGSFRLTGNAMVWDDLRVPMEATKNGGANDPTFTQFSSNGAGSRGVYAYSFPTNTAARELFFSTQLPHTWFEGSDLHPHIHWVPSNANAGNVVWGLECTWNNVNGVISTTTINTITVATPLAKTHKTDSFPTMSGAGKNISSMLSCRVFRDSNNVLDTYNSAAFLLEVDFHYQVDSLGSDNTGTKTY